MHYGFTDTRHLLLAIASPRQGILVDEIMRGHTRDTLKEFKTVDIKNIAYAFNSHALIENTKNRN